MALQWYVVHTIPVTSRRPSGIWNRPIDNAGLEEKFGQILVPTEQVTEMKQGKRSTSTKKFLPSYILVEMDLDKVTQKLVVSTPGITNFVGAGQAEAFERGRGRAHYRSDRPDSRGGGDRYSVPGGRSG